MSINLAKSNFIFGGFYFWFQEIRLIWNGGQKVFLSEEFEEMYTKNLSGLLYTNIPATLCLFDALYFEFERWVYDITSEITEERQDAVENISDMMHQMTGAGVQQNLTLNYAHWSATMTQSIFC